MIPHFNEGLLMQVYIYTYTVTDFLGHLDIDFNPLVTVNFLIRSFIFKLDLSLLYIWYYFCNSLVSLKVDLRLFFFTQTLFIKGYMASVLIS